MAAPDLSADITTLGTSPAAVTVDGQTTSERPIGDVIQADRYLNARAARSTKKRGLMFSKILPAGNPADQQTSGIGGVNFARPGGY